MFRRINGSDHLQYDEAHLRNDYAGKFNNSWISSTTTAGLAGNFSKTKWRSWAGASQGPDVPNTPAGLAAMTHTPYNFTTFTQNKVSKLQEGQIYIYESAGFLQERILLSGGLSQYWGTLTRTDNSGVAAIGDRTLSISSSAASYGAVIRPIKPLSFFFGHNNSGAAMPGSLQAGNPAISSTANPPYRPSTGTQDEYGVKTSFLNDTLTFSVVHFDITQTNYSVPNSEYYTLVAQGNQAAANLLPQNTFLDVNSKGWEVEGTYALNRNLTCGQRFLLRVSAATGVRIRAVPDDIWAVYADYRFTDGALNGWGFNIGVDSKIRHGRRKRDCADHDEAARWRY